MIPAAQVFEWFAKKLSIFGTVFHGHSLDFDVLSSTNFEMQLSCKHDSNKLPQYFIQTRLKKKIYQVISWQFFSRKNMHIKPQKIAPKSSPTFGLLWAPATMVHSVGGLDFDMRKLPLKKGVESRWRSLPLMQILLQNVKMVLMFAKDSIYKSDMWQSSRFRTNLQSFILPFSSNKWKFFHIPCFPP